MATPRSRAGSRPEWQKLSAWAKNHGLTYKGAYRLFRIGKLPTRTLQLPTGTILVHDPVPAGPAETRAVLYARVSSADQRADLDRQLDRLRAFAAGAGFVIDREVKEIGSGLNGSRKRLLAVLRDADARILLVEHRDRLTRFGFDYLQAALDGAERRIAIVNEGECEDDLVKDMIDVLTSFCARMYGRRSARNRAKRALEACARAD